MTVPDPVLRKKSKPIKKTDQKTKKLIDNLIDTAKAQNEPKGVGLSAVQIGQLKRVFVALVGKNFIEFINPEITWKSKTKFSQKLDKKKQFMEGCLSIPGYYALVDRPHSVKLKWQNLKDKIHERKFTGKQSAYVQHELDHLNGVLFVDRALKQKQRIYQSQKDEQGKEELVEVEF